MPVGEKISTTRKSKGISQESLADSAGVSLRTIQRIEKNEATPRPYTIKVIAHALGIPVEELTSLQQQPATTSTEPDPTGQLRVINMSALAGLILPLGNIILPVLIWRKHKHTLMVDEAARKIISFQVVYTLATLIVLVVTQLLLLGLTGSVMIGRFPLLFCIYFSFGVINACFTLLSTFQLQKDGYPPYSFIPALF